jgi:hypothetical protein
MTKYSQKYFIGKLIDGHFSEMNTLGRVRVLLWRKVVRYNLYLFLGIRLVR